MNDDEEEEEGKEESNKNRHDRGEEFLPSCLLSLNS